MERRGSKRKFKVRKDSKGKDAKDSKDVKDEKDMKVEIVPSVTDSPPPAKDVNGWMRNGRKGD